MWGLLYDSQITNTKRKVFISFHHKNDEIYCDSFKQLFSEQYEVFTDRSLDDEIESDNDEYIHRTIREKNIRGTSTTIVLCGAETWKRKHVDWEIHSTLQMGHALLGIGLPTAVYENGGVKVPNRYHVNYISNFAPWISWTTDPQTVKAAIESALSRNTRLIDNSTPLMRRNLP